MNRNRIQCAGMALILSVIGCRPPPLTSEGVVGVFGGIGLGPGEFSYPRAITTAPDGSVFVVDKAGRVQRFSRSGQFEIEWTMPDRQAGLPVGLSVHPDSRVFVADTHYHRVLIFDREGRPLGGFGEEGEGDGQFLLPTDAAFDDDGFIYVSEYGGNDRITRWSPTLTFQNVVTGNEVAGKRLSRPAGIDIDREQTLWVADACNHRIIRLSLDGAVLTVFGSMGTDAGQMRYPYDIAVTPDDRLLVCEYGNSRLQWFDKTGRSLRVWGKPGRNMGELWSPWGVATESDGTIYVVDSLNSRVQIIRL